MTNSNNIITRGADTNFIKKIYIIFFIFLLSSLTRSEVSNISSILNVYANRVRYQSALTPILLVPGFGGSILFRGQNRVWATVNPNNDCIYLLNLTDRSIDTSLEDYGLWSLCDLGIWGPITDVKYYKDIINSFTSIGYVHGVNLFGFPYDWRFEPNNSQTLSRFHEMIENINPIVIAHSMGGLLVEEYFRAYPKNSIRKFIAISTPFKGAGGNALKAFLTGYNMGNPYLTDTILMKQLAKEFFSTYWLLPQPTLQPQPKIIDRPAMEYLLPSINMFPRRYIIRKPIKILDTDVYYLTTDQVNTPYDYDHTTNYFTGVNGDGTVPIQSSFHAMEHGQPKSNNILINTKADHLGILASNELFDELYSLTNNDCDYRGKYISATGQYIIMKQGGSYEYDYLWYRDCMRIDYKSVIYNREIGNECAGYSLYHLEKYDTYEFKIECVYGWIYETNITLCKDIDSRVYKCRYDYLKGKILIKNITETPTIELSNQTLIKNITETPCIELPSQIFTPLVIGFGITICILLCIVIILSILIQQKYKMNVVYSQLENYKEYSE